MANGMSIETPDCFFCITFAASGLSGGYLLGIKKIAISPSRLKN
jgi:hypothetical protein